MKCVRCGTEVTERRGEVDYDSLPGTRLKNVPIRECPECGESYTGIPNMEGLDETLAKLVISQSTRLTGDEIRFLRKYLGLSQEDLARKMGVQPESISRWENERANMSEPHERLLRSIAVHETPVDDYTKAVPEDSFGEAREWRMKLTTDDHDWDPAAA